MNLKPDPILVLSTAVDVATDDVIRELDKFSVPYLRIDTESFPFSAQFSFALQGSSDAAISFAARDRGCCDILRPRSLWYRRMRAPENPVGMDPGIYEFCLRESRAMLLGAAITTSCRAMSRPEAVWRAEFKPLQLAAARSVGLTVPDTLISNSPEHIRSFFESVSRRMVIKPVRTGYFEIHGEPHVVYTNRFLESHLGESAQMRMAPSIYQEFIDKTLDIRATFVGGRIFCAAIHSQTDVAAAVDWRRTEDPSLPHTPHELPRNLESRISELMSNLGLEFGALDFALTSEGEYYFLEVNPNGQWLWLDRILDLGISRAVASWLAG